MTYPFSFEAVCFDPLASEGSIPTYNLLTGMGFATSYADAADKIDKYCGNDLMKIKTLELYEESTLLLLSKEVITKYAHDEYPYCVLCNADGDELTEGEECK